MSDDFKWLSRTELLIGREGIDILQAKHVLIVGMGGVGSFAAEFIARAGIGKMTIADGDIVDISNCNRQLPALQTTVGMDKVSVMGQRLRDINPNLELHEICEFLSPERMEELIGSQQFDYVVDCIDSVTPKLSLITTALRHRIPLISSMGAGGRVDPTKIDITDIWKTINCPFAQHIRKRLRRMGWKGGFTVVYSHEGPDPNSLMRTDGTNFKKSAYGTMSWLPASFGAFAASWVVRDLLDRSAKEKAKADRSPSPE
jgi:tRNA A37 threonylcarbamoyladenosine dehydratase